MSGLNSSSVVIREASFVTSTLNDEVVMMNPESGAYYGLNETASAIWELLDKAKPVDFLVARLAEDYYVERSQCERDVLDALEYMWHKGLIKIAH